MTQYTVTATVNALGVTSQEVTTFPATDPDDACGKAIGEFRGTFGDDADIHVLRIVKASLGTSPALAMVA